MADWQYSPDPEREDWHLWGENEGQWPSLEDVKGWLREHDYIVAKPIDRVLDHVLDDDPDSPTSGEYVKVAYFREGDV